MFNDTRRGDIWFADDSMGPRDPDSSHVTWGNRPVLVISNNAYNANSPVVTVIPITSSARKVETVNSWPSHVALSAGAHTGLQYDSVALIEQITTQDRESLTHWVGEIDSETMTKIEQALHALLQI